MAFGDLSSSPSLTSAVKSSNAFAGIVMPLNGWQLEILHMPLTTTYNDIENLFAKYGNIEKIGIFYKSKDKSINCYLSFDQGTNSDDALKENGKKVGVSSISVIKFVNSDSPAKGNKRLRTDDDGGWGAKADNGGWGASNTSSSDAWGSTPANSPARGGGGRGGRGGGGAGGGGSRACFKCGEEGHMSRECPKGGGGGGGSSRACFKCGEEGHMSRECPKGGGGGGGGSRACFKCGEEGHMSRECPKGGGRGCFNCGEDGHMSRDCSKPRRGRGGGGNFGNRGNNNNSNSNSNAGDSWGSSDTTAATSTAGGWD